MAVFAAVLPGCAQENTAADAAAASNNVAHPLEQKEAKRLFGIIPNFRTSNTLHPYVALTAKQKFHVATQDSLDRGTVVLGAAFGGLDQITSAEKSYGQGVQGYARYFAASWASYVIGDYMTEAIYPTLLHQDPRYFRLGEGGAWKRFGYALGQIAWTHSDSGKGQFNYSELIGNSTAVAISETYYPSGRTAGSALSSLGNQLAVDAASNVLKEFWPEIERTLHHKHSDDK